MSKLRTAFGIALEDGVGRMLGRAGEYARAEASRRYSAIRYDPDAPECRVAAEDWDHLLILDACRYDQFERTADLPGRLEARTSLGSCTLEFLTANFEGRSCHDTVYVTANPMYRTADLGEVFHDVVDVWRSDWDRSNRTVRPEELVAATLDAEATYPHKRILAHFVQPHYPFLGERGQALEEAVGGDLSGVEWIHRYATGEGSIEKRRTPWDLLDRGVLKEAEVRAAYDENLRLTLPHVRELLEKLPGKTVVTSDHGNLIGERSAPFSGPVYGHPPRTYVEGLRKVPWLVVDDGHRRRVRAEEPGEQRSEAPEVVAERLADLGYT